MKKIVLCLVAMFTLMTAVPTTSAAGNYHTLELRENYCISFESCGKLFGLLWGYRNYSSHREFGFYDSDGDWHCLYHAGYNC